MFLSGERRQSTLWTLQISLLWLSEMPRHCANAKPVNHHRRVQQRLVNYWLAQRTFLHWQISISTKVLFFGVDLGRSHLVAGKARGQPGPWWFCLQYGLATAPRSLPCLPATQRAAERCQQVPPSPPSPRGLHPGDEHGEGHNLVHWRPPSLKRKERVCTALVLGSARLRRRPRMSSNLVPAGNWGHPSQTERVAWLLLVRLLNIQEYLEGIKGGERLAWGIKNKSSANLQVSIS